MTIPKLLISLVLLVSTGGVRAQQATDPGESTPFQTKIVTDISLLDGRVYYNLREGEVVPEALVELGAWDVAFDRVALLVHGEGQLLASDFDAVRQASATGYLPSGVDLPLDLPEGLDWYRYNPTTHVVSARFDRTFVLRLKDGSHAKLQFLSYYKQGEPDKGALRYVTFRYAWQPDGTPVLETPADPSALRFFPDQNVVE
jgi:hypothetical protein